jgi:hypothetical protein
MKKQEEEEVEGGMKLKDIAKIVDMSEAGISLSIKSSMNKLVDKLVEETDYDIFDVCIGLMEYLGCSGKEIYKKLNDRNRWELRQIAKQRFFIKSEEKEGKFDQMFSKYFEE